MTRHSLFQQVRAGFRAHHAPAVAPERRFRSRHPLRREPRSAGLEPCWFHRDSVHSRTSGQTHFETCSTHHPATTRIRTSPCPRAGRRATGKLTDGGPAGKAAVARRESPPTPPATICGASGGTRCLHSRRRRARRSPHQDLRFSSNRAGRTDRVDTAEDNRRPGRLAVARCPFGLSYGYLGPQKLFSRCSRCFPRDGS